jgi:hypothetical protein
MKARKNPVNIDNDTETGSPFHDSLAILARIISRVYRWDMLILRLYIPSNGLETYIEWPLIGVDGASILVPAACCYSESVSSGKPNWRECYYLDKEITISGQDQGKRMYYVTMWDLRK